MVATAQHPLLTQPIRILALGDSYTIGEGVQEAERWPMQLAQHLRSEQWEVAVPTIIATTGWTTAELQEGIAATLLQPPYDLIFLSIGVNNQYRGLPQAQYKAEFTALLKQAIGFADKRPQHVIVISIPDWGATPFAAGRDTAQIAQEIEAFNAIKKQVAQQASTWFVDITPISREAQTNPDLLAADGLHPSGTMYQKWVEKILPVVHQALESRASSLF